MGEGDRMRRWVFDEAGWAGARAVLRLPGDVVAQLPPVPAPTTSGGQPSVPTAGVAATLAPLRAALTVVALGQVTVELVQHRGGRAMVSRFGCAGRPVGGMTVAVAGTDVAVEVRMGQVDDLVAAVMDRLGLTTADVATTVTTADRPAEETLAVDLGALAGGGSDLPPWARAALGGQGGAVDRDVVRIDGPAGPAAAALVHRPDGVPVWIRAHERSVQLRPTTTSSVRDWLVRATGSQLARVGVASDG